MYSEKTFKNYIFWIQVKRVVLIILLSCIGAAIGVLISELYESIARTNTYNVAIIVVSTILMFLLSLLFTAGTGKEVQDGYWKVAVLRKLTAIQKLIETNNSLLGNNENVANILPKKEDIGKTLNSTSETEKEELEYEDDVEVQVNNEEDSKKFNNKVENKKGSKNKQKRKIKKVKEVV